MRRLAWLVGVALATVACEATPPGRPGWDQDVLPLLQGRCNHCHGESVARVGTDAMGMPLGAQTRLDFCNGESAPLMELGAVVGKGAVINVRTYFPIHLEPREGSGRATMPPPPADPLSDYEYQVLKKWVRIIEADAAAACQKAVPNRPPRVRIVAPPRQTDQAVEAVVEITDADHDGLVGKATLGDFGIDIPGGGRRTLVFPRQAPVSGELRIAVTDGYEIGRL